MTSTREKNLAAVRGAFAGVSAADVDQMLQWYTDDLTLELPYADPPVTVEGKEAVHAYLTQAFRIFRFALEITAVHECADADELVVEYASTGAVTTTGKPYVNTYIGVYHFRDGRICRVKEFYNPLPAMGAVAAE